MARTKSNPKPFNHQKSRPTAAYPAAELAFFSTPAPGCPALPCFGVLSHHKYTELQNSFNKVSIQNLQQEQLVDTLSAKVTALYTTLSG